MIGLFIVCIPRILVCISVQAHTKFFGGHTVKGQVQPPAARSVVKRRASRTTDDPVVDVEHQFRIRLGPSRALFYYYGGRFIAPLDLARGELG